MWAMPTDAEITFADHMGRFYARRYAFPPMVGRLLGYLAVCDPPEQSIGELAEALLASRSAIAGAVKVLETTHAIRRTRVAGERMDRVRIDLSSPQSLGMDISEYEELSELAREGLEVLRGRAAGAACGAAGDVGVRRLPAGAGAAARSRSGRRGARRWSPRASFPSNPRGGQPMSDGARRPAIVAAGLRKSFGETIGARRRRPQRRRGHDLRPARPERRRARRRSCGSCRR